MEVFSYDWYENKNEKTFGVKFNKKNWLNISFESPNYTGWWMSIRWIIITR